MANPDGAGGVGGLSWEPVASGDSNNPPNLALETGVYRLVVDLPVGIPDWVLGWFRGIPGVQAITAIGSTLTVYFRA